MIASWCATRPFRLVRAAAYVLVASMYVSIAECTMSSALARAAEPVGNASIKDCAPSISLAQRFSALPNAERSPLPKAPDRRRTQTGECADGARRVDNVADLRLMGVGCVLLHRGEIIINPDSEINWRTWVSIRLASVFATGRTREPLFAVVVPGDRLALRRPRVCSCG